MDFVNILGILAATFTTGAFLPQVIKTWKSGSAADLSFWMFAIMITGVVLWLAYGIIKEDLPIILANTITFLLIVILMYFKFTFKA